MRLRAGACHVTSTCTRHTHEFKTTNYSVFQSPMCSGPALRDFYGALTGPQSGARHPRMAMLGRHVEGASTVGDLRFKPAAGPSDRP